MESEPISEAQIRKYEDLIENKIKVTGKRCLVMRSRGLTREDGCTQRTDLDCRAVRGPSNQHSNDEKGGREGIEVAR